MVSRGESPSWGVDGWFIVDPATGAMWTLDPEDVQVTLKKIEAFRELQSKMKLVTPETSMNRP